MNSMKMIVVVGVNGYSGIGNFSVVIWCGFMCWCMLIWVRRIIS